ncbi:MAG: Uma2 family endonuclease, partial [Acidobacteriota bacterium]
TPIGSRHAACVDRIAQILFERARGKAIVRVQSPVRLSERSEPQPDLGLLKRRRDFYAGGHPEPKDVLLLVEVTDTSQEFDRGVKVPLYAHSSIPEVWIVDLGAESVEIYTKPSAEGYRKIDIFKRRQTISCQSIAELKLAVDEILG